MKKAFRNFVRITVLATIFSLTGLVLSGEVMAQQCVDNGDGTVTDNGSGLMWQKETAGTMNWYNAVNYAAGLNLGGKTGWRLPARNELQGLYYSPCKSKMSEQSLYYWSSTPYARVTDLAWLVFFGNGDVYSALKSYSYYVRAVRSAR